MVLSVVLLSGGLDSSTALATVVEKGNEAIALTFDYGQRHRKELESASRVARHYGVRSHIIIELDIGRHLRSSLTNATMTIPTDGNDRDGVGGIPDTYVPGRNIVFLSVASAIAEGLGADEAVIAANAIDYSGYPDCTPDCINAFQKTLAVGTKRGVSGRPVRVEAPLLNMTKADIVREAVRLSVPIHLTWSCYMGGDRACGKCDSCRLRLRGFEEAGEEDPLPYEGGNR
ncbi:MAG: 7-cyano-7-deazaguanine synthase QueC [Methanobacteriota archaeon]|nr:MAG: 7-cyano-7-deazaguanine synthase QueC [Euryarchaeota archaeon]